jgi:hypothetical protein
MTEWRVGGKADAMDSKILLHTPPGFFGTGREWVAESYFRRGDAGWGIRGSGLIWNDLLSSSVLRGWLATVGERQLADIFALPSDADGGVQGRR